MKNYDAVSQAAKDTPLAEMIGGLGNKIQKNYSSKYQKVSKKFGKEADKIAGKDGNIELPANKCLLFSYKKRKGNPEGHSPLKDCFQPWTYKKTIENYKTRQSAQSL